ncbi:AAA family ATPase [Azospirillum brasilense]|uniref:ATP-binding cassette domain-containing protein n=1 Tax=Azospirillum brasilense TaxID=192 RepID=A0A6L3B6E4_AZOBR|nr:AAA family ATPase [Azospirillum brasilense]KAA0688203.1 ATP-binding cassette domain-containing protein [Azospirillum brasilense]
MYFTVLAHGTRTPTQAKSKAYLLTDNWDDWFKYSTLYTLLVFDAEGERHIIGGVKIGQFRMADEQRRPDIPKRFDQLDERFFSLGQDDSYYDHLNELGPNVRDKVLCGIRDVALDLELFERALKEKVTGTSLLRSVSHATVRGQFHRMACGGVRLSRYEFSYTAPKQSRGHINPMALAFVVEPESYPPTNIHVLIGRNGVGKTTLLNNMTRAIVEKNVDAVEVGAFSTEVEELLDNRMFTNLVSVTFSAFDPFEPLPSRQDKSEGVQYAYIGLKRVGSGKDGKPLPPKSPERLSTEFGSSVSVCRQGARASRWRRALEMLEADPIFREAEVADLASDDVDDEELKVQSRKLFAKLSSGHKIVLLTITRLVETVEEKTLVLLDEPEAHLHPPLLSAFVRALSDLLINRNGVAVIATHSPVVLQEVPKSCVWKIRRSGARAVAERPEIETFGENVGILTREIFGLEVTHSGFHKLLRDAVAREADFDAVVQRFGGELGGEARAIIRALIAAREPEDDNDR